MPCKARCLISKMAMLELVLSQSRKMHKKTMNKEEMSCSIKHVLDDLTTLLFTLSLSAKFRKHFQETKYGMDVRKIRPLAGLKACLHACSLVQQGKEQFKLVGCHSAFHFFSPPDVSARVWA